VATLTFVYADSTAVLGPLSTRPEPFAYDLCTRHAESMTPPRGWEVIRLAPETIELAPSREDLVALADVVRQRGRHLREDSVPMRLAAGGRHGHLRVLPGQLDAGPLQ
jgi:hypothetical protein